MEKASFEIPLWSPKASSRAAVWADSVVLLALGAVGVVWSVIEPGPSRFAIGGLVISAGLVLVGLCVTLIARVAGA